MIQHTTGTGSTNISTSKCTYIFVGINRPTKFNLTQTTLGNLHSLMTLTMDTTSSAEISNKRLASSAHPSILI